MEVGFIGCGKQAVEHAKAVVALGHKVAFCAGSSLHSNTALSFATRFKCDIRSFDTAITQRCDRLVISTPAQVTHDMATYLFSMSIPLLVEKPFSFDLIPSSSHISVGYNRRWYHTTQTLKTLIENNAVEHTTFLINEMITDKSKRTGLDRRKTCLFSFGHAVDLMFYLRLDSSSYHVKMVQDKALQTELTVVFKNGWVAKMQPFEHLIVYDRLNINSGGERKYAPNAMITIHEPRVCDIKEGILFQMKHWLEGRQMASVADEQKAFNFIEKNFLHTS